MLIILVGPSGAGKTTIETSLVERGVKKMISATTRAPRVGEVHGEDYFFLTEEEFLRDSGKFFETAQYAGNYYGTLCSQVNKAAMSKDAYVTVMEIEGAKKLREAFPDNVLLLYVNRSRRDLVKAINARQILASEKRCRVRKLNEDVLARGECDCAVNNYSGRLNKAVDAVLNIADQHFDLNGKLVRQVVTAERS